MAAGDAVEHAKGHLPDGFLGFLIGGTWEEIVQSRMVCITSGLPSGFDVRGSVICDNNGFLIEPVIGQTRRKCIISSLADLQRGQTWSIPCFCLVVSACSGYVFLMTLALLPPRQASLVFGLTVDHGGCIVSFQLVGIPIALMVVLSAASS